MPQSDQALWDIGLRLACQISGTGIAVVVLIITPNALVLVGQHTEIQYA